MTKARDPVIRTAPQLADLNLNGNIFGGWILSQMDIAGGITASKRAGGPVATVAVEAMKFHRPVHVGDLVSCYAEIERVGRTSMHVRIEVCVTRRGIEKEFPVTEGMFIFVAVDEAGRPQPVPQEGTAGTPTDGAEAPSP
ncbi:MAG: acyl-CoA thioesterase [Rhodothalassiaceae bacterium]